LPPIDELLQRIWRGPDTEIGQLLAYGLGFGWDEFRMATGITEWRVLPMQIAGAPVDFDPGVWLLGDDNALVVVALLPERVIVATPQPEWVDEASLVYNAASARLIRRDDPEFKKTFALAVEEASGERYDAFVDCLECGDSTPPEHLSEDDICRRCEGMLAYHEANDREAP
jgi:hypothetical protein